MTTTTPTASAVAPASTAARPFRLQLAITGAMAPGVIETIRDRVPCKIVSIIYEQDMPLPRLWNDTSAPAGQQWKPVNHGSSIFDDSKGWSLAKLKDWCRNRARYLAAAGETEVVLDIEDVPPLMNLLKRDRPDNYLRMHDDLCKRMTVDFAQADDMVAFAVRQLWSTTIDAFEAEGLRVSLYDHMPSYNEPDPKYLRQDRCWLDKRLAASRPCIYEWEGNRSADLHETKVIRPRIRAAQRLCPLAPCYPFVWPFISRKVPASPQHFASMIRVSREEGCAGVTLWHDCKDTTELKLWTSVFATHVLPAITGVFAP